MNVTQANQANEHVAGSGDLLEVGLAPSTFEAHHEGSAPVDSVPVAPAASRRMVDALAGICLALVGAALFVALWAALASARPDLPSPAQTFTELRSLLAQPFRAGGPSGAGVGVQLMASLEKVFLGFGFAALFGIPLGFAVGASKVAWRAFNPVVQVLRPVSPLAWFPIALAVLKDAGQASIYTIGVTALWPTLINTAFGVAGVPHDYRNVAKVFRFGRVRYVTHVLIPHSLSATITGLRLSMGVAWMVIVAAEMLSGGTGIGFFVWDSYNNNMAAVVSAILFIGVIGFVLDVAFASLARRFDYGEIAT